MRFLVSMMVWSFVLTGLVAAASRLGFWLRVIVRILYLGVALFVGLGLFWAWAGDGTMNLVAVPVLLVAAALAVRRWASGAIGASFKGVESSGIRVALTLTLTFALLALLHAIIPGPLEIS